MKNLIRSGIEKEEVDLYKNVIAFVLKDFIYCLQTHKYKSCMS